MLVVVDAPAKPAKKMVVLKLPIATVQSLRRKGEFMNKIVVAADVDLEDLIPSYLENRRGDVDAMTKALESDDFGAVRILGHSMKGSGGGYGFDGISKIGSHIETAAQNSNAKEASKHIAELTEYLDNVEVIYEDE